MDPDSLDPDLIPAFQVNTDGYGSKVRDIQATGEAFLLLLWVIFALLDPDPDLDSESGSGGRSTDLMESGSETLAFIH